MRQFHARGRAALGPSELISGIVWQSLQRELAKPEQRRHQSGRRFQLPGEAQWEAAARGLRGRDYPWEGAGLDASRANTYESHLRRTSPIGVYPAGATPGERPLYDLAGNVWEWTASLYRDYPLNQEGSQDDPEDAGSRMVRGVACVF